jgi:hypothetical protein
MSVEASVSRPFDRGGYSSPRIPSPLNGAYGKHGVQAPNRQLLGQRHPPVCEHGRAFIPEGKTPGSSFKRAFLHPVLYHPSESRSAHLPAGKNTPPGKRTYLPLPGVTADKLRNTLKYDSQTVKHGLTDPTAFAYLSYLNIQLRTQRLPDPLVEDIYLLVGQGPV